VKTEKLGGVAGGEGDCGDDVAGWLVRERRSLDILPVKKEAKLLIIYVISEKKSVIHLPTPLENAPH